MGYSSRYHAASLAAVFLALAIGILIGAALGSDIVTGTAEDLEEGLGDDLDRLRAENAELKEQVEELQGFEERIYPAVVARRLAGQEVALVGLGPVDTTEYSGAVEDALEPAGASLAAVATVATPPDAEALVAALGPAEQGLPRGAALRAAAQRAGARLLGQGELGDARAALLSSFSGDVTAVDAAVLVRAPAEGLSPREEADTQIVEEGLLEGMARMRAPLVGVERTDTDPSQVEFFTQHGISSVDNVDTVAGRVALVLALDGAEGAFGVKETADGLLPDLLPVGGAGP